MGALTRILYLVDSDTVILASGITGSADWTAIGTHIEVYHGRIAGNTTLPSLVITLSSPNPKTIAAGQELMLPCTLRIFSQESGECS